MPSLICYSSAWLRNEVLGQMKMQQEETQEMHMFFSTFCFSWARARWLTSLRSRRARLRSDFFLATSDQVIR